MIELVTRRRRVHRELVELVTAQITDRIHGRIDLGENADDTGHQCAPPGNSCSPVTCGCAMPSSRLCSNSSGCGCLRFGGTTSLSSAIAITGSCLMNSRNHMKNQPKLPIRIE